MKNQKGITLVALIITIIVMLILAGVSISLVVGENGVLTQAQNAGTETKQAEAEQAVSLAFNDLMMQYYGSTAADKTDVVYTKAKLVTAINANGFNITESDIDNDINAAGIVTITIGDAKVCVKLETSTVAGIKMTKVGDTSETAGW